VAPRHQNADVSQLSSPTALIGLPVGYFLCFKLGWGAVGIWIGLCGGLMIIGQLLLFTLAAKKSFRRN